MLQPTSNYLPPNIAPQSSNPKVPALVFEIASVTYFQPISPQPSFIRYKWWGLGHNKIQQPLSKKSHIFYISVSVPIFLRYLRDMKILQIQLCNSVGVGMIRGCINWMVLSQWKGEREELMVQLKSIKGNVIICQAKVIIKVQEITNPFYIQKPKQQINNNTQPNVSKIPQQTLIKTVVQHQVQKQKIHPQPRISIHQSIDNGEQNRSPLIPTYNFIDYGPEYNKPSSFGYDNLLSENIIQNVIAPPKHQIQLTESQKKIQLFRKLNLPLPDNCICPDIEGNKFTRQKLKLREDIDLFFNTKVTEFSPKNTEQVIIQVNGWECFNKVDQILPCRILVPLLEQSKDNDQKVYHNQYNLSKPKGQQIHLKINKGFSETAIKDYITKNELQIRVGEHYSGTVPLWKVIASKGDIVSVSVSDRRNKRDILKGYLHLKLANAHQQKKAGQNQNNSNKKQPFKPQESDISPQILHRLSIPINNYMWLYIRQLHFLEPRYHEGSNIFIKLKPNSSSFQSPSQNDQHLQSKTVWNNVSPTFNQIFTINLGKARSENNKIMIEFWNRKETQRLVGKAQLSSSQLQNMLELPIEDQHGRTVAYIELCIGKGDIADATQFINTHMKAFMRKPQRQHHQEQSQNNQQKSESERSHKSERDPPKSEQSSLPNSSIQNEHEFHLTPVPSIPLSIPHNDPDLTVLQVHNKIFTAYIKGQHSWLDTYQNNLLTIAEFTQLIKPLLASFSKNNSNLMKFISVYIEPVDSLVRLDQVRQSFDSFQVYYKILTQQRDQVLATIVEQLQDQAINLNELQQKIDDKLIRVAPKNKLQMLWRAFKQQLPANTTEKLRYFYENCNIHEVCDAIRKYEVYESTSGEQVPVQVLAKQVNIEICELLQSDPHSPNLKSIIKQAGVQLSKFEQLCIFGEIAKKSSVQTGMTKSPTFGHLNTDRISAPKFNQQHLNAPAVLFSAQVENNPSLSLNLDHRSSDVSNNLSEKFGNPGVSPIHNQPNRHKNDIVHVQFMDTSGLIEQVRINRQVYSVDQMDLNNADGLDLPVHKSFNYEGYIKIEGKGILEYEGAAGQWISLVNEIGEYCGCILLS